MRHMSYTCHSYNYSYHKMLDIFFQSWRIVAQQVHYIFIWFIILYFTSGNTSFCLPQIVKGKNSSIDQRKIEFVEKVSNDVKSEEVSFFFIYYFKNFGKIKLVS